MLRDLLSRMLNEHHLVLESDGVEGVERLNQQRFDIVISDVGMRTMDGPEMILAAGENVPAGVIMISGGDPGFTETREKIASIMAVRTVIFIAKPFSIEELEAHIATCLSR